MTETIYPESQALRSGCKVSWRYYDRREDAEVASAIARADAERQLARGYDFGYCSPGSITWVEPGAHQGRGGANGRWEVCLP